MLHQPGMVSPPTQPNILRPNILPVILHNNKPTWLTQPVSQGPCQGCTMKPHPLMEPHHEALHPLIKHIQPKACSSSPLNNKQSPCLSHRMFLSKGLLIPVLGSTVSHSQGYLPHPQELHPTWPRWPRCRVTM